MDKYSKSDNPKTRGRRAHIRTRSRHSQFFVRDVVPRDGEVEGPSLFQGRRMWPQASRIRRPLGPACGGAKKERVKRVVYSENSLIKISRGSGAGAENGGSRGPRGPRGLLGSGAETKEKSELPQ